MQAWVAASRHIVGFTGAGISTESGIPDFRSADGFWARNRIVDFGEFLSSEDGRIEYWRQKVANWPAMRAARPNAGHAAFVHLHSLGKLSALITQNIDGLHQASGLPAEIVIELHGTTTEASCLSCSDRITSDEACERVQAGELAPRCLECGGLLKPATISFGQPLSPEVLRRARREVEECDLLIAVGSSLVVEPAASLPRLAKYTGARLVIVNRDATPVDSEADAVVRGEIGDVLPMIVGLGPGPLPPGPDGPSRDARAPRG